MICDKTGATLPSNARQPTLFALFSFKDSSTCNSVRGECPTSPITMYNMLEDIGGAGFKRCKYPVLINVSLFEGYFLICSNSDKVETSSCFIDQSEFYSYCHFDSILL